MNPPPGLWQVASISLRESTFIHLITRLVGLTLSPQSGPDGCLTRNIFPPARKEDRRSGVDMAESAVQVQTDSNPEGWPTPAAPNPARTVRFAKMIVTRTVVPLDLLAHVALRTREPSRHTCYSRTLIAPAFCIVWSATCPPH